VTPSLPAGSSVLITVGANGGLPIARSKSGGRMAFVKSASQMSDSGYSSFAIRAVMGSRSTPRNDDRMAMPSGISALNKPVPTPPSKIAPPVNPSCRSPFQTARTIYSGV
jgi:hypothetical protein